MALQQGYPINEQRRAMGVSLARNRTFESSPLSGESTNFRFRSRFPRGSGYQSCKAVAEIVKKQVETGVDLVNDGEMSKPSYATYVKDRLTGFAGSSNNFVYQDLAEFPNLAKRVFNDPGRSRRRTPACTGPIGIGDPAAALADIDHLKAALSGVDAAGSFLSAASPGVISLFIRNNHYPSQEAYLFAIAEAMRGEYEAIAAAGVIVQIDCPDLAMGRHIQYADLSIDEFRKRAGLHIEALNH